MVAADAALALLQGGNQRVVLARAMCGALDTLASGFAGLPVDAALEEAAPGPLVLE